MTNENMKREDTFYGYTHQQIREMDVWFRKNNLSWEILDQRYRDGIEVGRKIENEIIQQHLEDLMKSNGGLK